MSKNYRKPNRYIQHQKKKEPSRGLLGDAAIPDVPKRTKLPWTLETDRELLEMVLEDPSILRRFDVLGDRSPLALHFGRSKHSVGSRLRKLAIRYRQEDVDGYQPCDYLCRDRSRTGLKWNYSDRYLMELAAGAAGKEKGADNAEWLANVLSRSVEDVVENFDG
jgi:hypothetical protein